MSRLWPHPSYAEEQPYPQMILYTHVVSRGFQAGSIVGSGIGTSVFLLRYLRILAPKVPPATFASTLLRSAGTGAAVGAALMLVAVPARMRGKEEIEWSDRSWRLLENKGQVEVDDWAYGGMALGSVPAVTMGKTLGLRGAVGSVAVGGLLGIAGYMGFRYGIHGGKHP